MLSAVDLLRLLVRDAADGLLDGRGSSGALSLGTCKHECQLSSETLRADFADSMALFLISQKNKSTIDPNAVTDFLERIARRHSELFPDDGMDPFDITPPTITVVASTVIDEANGSATVPLTGGVTANFSRYAADYGPDSAGIPRWRFQVQDDRSDAPKLNAQARLVRTSDQSELVPWFPVPPTVGSGYNREIVVSSALYAALATTSDTYQLEVRATDEKSNVSPITTVTWTQTIMPPPAAPVPSLVGVDSTATDESSVTASVNDSGAVYAGTPGVVTLSASSTPSYTRYASHYASPNDAGIPKWHFMATEGSADVTVQARLVRSSDQAVLVSWFTVPPVLGAGYNREIIVSGALHPDVGTLNGGYQLELVATDASGTASPTVTVTWNQTVLAPPIRQRVAPSCDPASDGQCPGHYSLQGNLDASVAINGIGLPNGLLHIAHYYIDNPNPVPVRVSATVTTSLTWSRGRRNWINPIVNPVPYSKGCQPNQGLDGSCYAFPTPNVEDVAVNQYIGSVATNLQVLVNGSDPGPCSGCGAQERELPANSTAEVWISSKPYSFLWSGYPLGRLTNPNMPATAIGSQAETWIHWATSGSSSIAIFAQAWWYLSRVSVTPAVRSTLQSRPANSQATLAAAIGSSTSSFPATVSLWSTWAPGQSSF